MRVRRQVCNTHCNAAGQVVLKLKRPWHDDTTLTDTPACCTSAARVMQRRAGSTPAPRAPRSPGPHEASGIGWSRMAKSCARVAIGDAVRRHAVGARLARRAAMGLPE